jgi:transcriptional regulator with XRE-family HTH domain
MARARKLTADAYVVNTLRFRGDMSQAELGEAIGVSQTEISKYEKGAVPVPEATLRRIAEAAQMDWSLVVHLQRFFAMLLPAAERRQGVRVAEPPGLEVFEPARLAVMPYLIEDAEAEAAGQAPEEARREAEEL